MGLRVQSQPGLWSETLFQTLRQNCHFGAGVTVVWQSACLAFMKLVVYKPASQILKINKSFTFIPEYHIVN